MFGFVRKISSRVFVPAAWTLLTIMLLCLPGSAIPDVSMYQVPHVDKIVHFLLFGGIPFFWSLYVLPKFSRAESVKIVIGFCLFSIALGTALEYVQFYFVANRDFEVVDIFADSLGAICFGALVLLTRKN